MNTAGQPLTSSASPGRVKLCWLLMTALLTSEWLLLLAITVVSIATPSSPEFLSSLLQEPEGDDILRLFMVLLFSSTLQVYILMCVVQITQLLFGIVLFFMFTMSDMVGGQQRQGTKGGVGANHEARVRLYRELQLLTDEYNNLLASLHGITHGLIASLVTLCVYILVRTEGMMAAVASYLCI